MAENLGGNIQEANTGNGTDVSKIVGKQSVAFKNPPYIIAASSIAGKKEGEGPLGPLFDQIVEDPMVGKENWEAAESELMKMAAQLVLSKAGLKNTDIR